MPKQPMPSSTDAKLDEIIEHLRRMDHRDKMRLMGGYVRSLISLAWIVIAVWSSWYFITHGADLMKMVADQAASSAAAYTKDQSNGLLDQFMKQYSTPKK